MNSAPESQERQRNAALLLSTTGAAVAGVGLGAILSDILRPIALLVLIVGVASHLVGMIGNRRLQFATGYRPSHWELAAYWLCWAIILVLLAIVAAGLAGFV